MAQVAMSTLPVEDDESSESRMVVTFLMSALESMCKELAKSKAEVACIAVYETDVFVVGTQRGRAFVNTRMDLQKDFAKFCAGEGVSEVEPPCPATRVQTRAGEREELSRAVDDHFRYCYGKALGTQVRVPVPYGQMLRDPEAVSVRGLPEGVAPQNPENYDLVTLQWIWENKAGMSFIINRPFLGPLGQPGDPGPMTVTSARESGNPSTVKAEPLEDAGGLPSTAAVTVKKELEDPSYYQSSLQDVTQLSPSETREAPVAEVKVEGNTNSSSSANSATGVEDLNIVQVTDPDNEKETVTGTEKIKQIREQVNDLFRRKFGEAVGVDFPVKVPYRKITFNPGCVQVHGLPRGVVFKAPGYLETSSMQKILEAADSIKFTIVRPLPGLELSSVGKRKIDQEGRVFQEKWEQAYFFAEVQSMPVCLVCKQSMAVAKEYNLRRHYQTHHSHHYDQYTGLGREHKLQQLKAALRGYLLGPAGPMCPQHLRALAREAPAMETTRPTDDSAGPPWQKLREKLRAFVAYSLAIDEITDINNTAQLALFIRGVDTDLEASEELLDTVPITGARSAQVFSRVERSLHKFSIDWAKLVSVASTGTPAMVGAGDGLVPRLQARAGPGVRSLRCVLRPEALGVEALKMGHVMSVVRSAVACIRLRGSNCGPFSALLGELDAQYGSLLRQAELRWLGRGLVLRCFLDSLEDIDAFLAARGRPLEQLRDPAWVRDLAFLADVTVHLNGLHLSLLGPAQLVTQLRDILGAFEAKLAAWEDHLARDHLAYFPSLRAASHGGRYGPCYVPRLAALRAELRRRLGDFQLCESELRLFSAPFSVQADGAPEALRAELTELQRDLGLQARYQEAAGGPDFYRHLAGARFPLLRSHCARVLSMFGSTHICEQLFSIMKLSKAKVGTQPAATTTQWDSVLHVATG
ncbi:general transcription factor II-I repeat domain-containing protein 2A-like isoform X3 [Erinaceus europaeus]|uniref:General transcription factor II-I repeat domain-containing protein 2A-like isoform X3 n=1 Tax=Erinaceus europaeus TaxID=9365 RepID=A0ABM3VZ57_ERIEU|nr:general transcription factor II-I repeat domain-containing protein 2A-like isoform X3 [Erinaceus europaeus]